MSIRQKTIPQVQDLVPEAPLMPEHEFTLSGCSFDEVYQMAAWLHSAFAGSDSSREVVCLATENKAIICAALLAGLCGAPALLLPHALSGRVLARMQKATGFTTAISERADIVPLGTRILWPKTGTAHRLCFHPDPDRELLRLFTGGSTGSPKVWSKTSSNLFAEARYLADRFGITDQDLIVATISPCHIYGLLFSVLIPLVSSASVIARTPSFPAEIADAIQINEATILAAVPAHYRALRQQVTSKGSLRFAVSSAGMLDPGDNATFCNQNNTSIVEVYGSTETGGIASRNRMAGETDFTPFSTVDWKISRERLLVRSPYISLQTPRDKNGFFITGDRVEAVPGNSFALKGRMDGITKVAGKRVDLEEIREAIRQYPGVDDCFVLALPDPSGRENQICALVQATVLNKEDLFTSLQTRLESYGLPRVIRRTNTMPLTGAGKYDLAAIRRILSQ